MYEYEGVRRIVYNDNESEEGGATFVPVCKHCGNLLKQIKLFLLMNGRVNRSTKCNL